MTVFIGHHITMLTLVTQALEAFLDGSLSPSGLEVFFKSNCANLETDTVKNLD
jgi:hypothetical protein